MRKPTLISVTSVVGVLVVIMSVSTEAERIDLFWYSVYIALSIYSVWGVYVLGIADSRPLNDPPKYYINPLDFCDKYTEGPKVMGSLCLYTRIFIPAKAPKALICVNHGFGDHGSWTMMGTVKYFVHHGFAVASVDNEGHGLSKGLHGYISNVHVASKEIGRYYSELRQSNQFKNLKAFLYGESMGGAVSILETEYFPKDFDGMILVAPMCKISDEMKPPALVIEILKLLCKFIPTFAIVPTKDLTDEAIPNVEKRKIARNDPYGYRDQPRLKTGLELLYLTEYIEKNVHKISIPLLCLHGGSDKVTDPNATKELYSRVASSDKKLIIYDGFAHALSFGLSDSEVEMVMNDILAWVEARC